MKGYCVKVKGQISPGIELSLRIMPINNILKFENDCSTNREVIDRKPIFSEKLHERSLCQGQRSNVAGHRTQPSYYAYKQHIKI